MKQLLLCRHAKSSWKDLQTADFDRPLNKRGKRDAAIMGERLVQRGVQIEGIVSSPAKRAWTTARHLARALQYPVEAISFNDAIYHATPGALFAILRQLDDTLQRVLMVGHNPGLTLLVNQLAPQKMTNLPTCGIVSFAFSVERWEAILDMPGQVLFVDYPKKNIDQ